MNSPINMSHLTAALPSLSTRAVYVKLTQKKPTTSHRNEAGEAILKAELGDDANYVSTQLLKDPTNPCRILLNAHSAMYRDHIRLTREDKPRAPRLLFMSLHSEYIANQHKHENTILTLAQRYLPDDATYDRWVQMDIDRRLQARALLPGWKTIKLVPITPAEYPKFDNFKNGLSSHHSFTTLPDARHPIFDSSDEELAAMREAMQAEIIEREREITEHVRAQNRESIIEPLRKLMEKLAIPAGEPGSIFRDSAVENVTDAVKLARAMSLDDPTVVTMCDEVSAALSGHARNPQVLRDSPIVREQTVAKLNAVASKMDFMFGG